MIYSKDLAEDPTLYYSAHDNQLVKGKITSEGAIKLIKLGVDNNETEELEFGRYLYKFVGPKPIYNNEIFVPPFRPNKELCKIVRREIERSNIKEIIFAVEGAGISNNYYGR